MTNPKNLSHKSAFPGVNFGLREYREALRNYEDRNLAGLDLIEPLKKAVARQSIILRDKILLLPGGDGGVRPEEAYGMYKPWV
jgi:hypothetical protein